MKSGQPRSVGKERYGSTIAGIVSFELLHSLIALITLLLFPLLLFKASDKHKGEVSEEKQVKAGV